MLSALTTLTTLTTRLGAPALDADVSSTLTRGLEELTSGVNSLLIIGGLGIALYLVFAGLERALRATPARRVVSGVGVVVGGLYLLLSLVYVVSTQSPSLSLLLLAIVALVFVLSWQVVRDIFAGAVFRAGGVVRLGDHLHVEGVSGIVTVVGLRAFTVRAASSDEIVVPYGRLLGTSIRRSRSEEGGRAATLELTLREPMTPRRAMVIVERSALLNHWISIRHDPQLTAPTPGVLAVTVQLIEPGREIEVAQALQSAIDRETDDPTPTPTPLSAPHAVSVGESGPVLSPGRR